jgi:hypothetical protein
MTTTARVQMQEISGCDSQEAWRQDQVIGGTSAAVK